MHTKLLFLGLVGFPWLVTQPSSMILPICVGALGFGLSRQVDIAGGFFPEICGKYRRSFGLRDPYKFPLCGSRGGLASSVNCEL